MDNFIMGIILGIFIGEIITVVMIALFGMSDENGE